MGVLSVTAHDPEIPLANTKVPEFTLVVPVYVVVPPIVKVLFPVRVSPDAPASVLLIVALLLAVIIPEVLVMVPPASVKFPLAKGFDCLRTRHRYGAARPRSRIAAENGRSAGSPYQIGDPLVKGPGFVGAIPCPATVIDAAIARRIIPDKGGGRPIQSPEHLLFVLCPGRQETKYNRNYIE
jgi:hypothetical protein